MIPSQPDNGGGSTGNTDILHKGAKLRVKSTTYFKLQPKMASELTDAEKVLVPNGSEFDLEYYIDVGKTIGRSPCSTLCQALRQTSP